MTATAVRAGRAFVELFLLDRLTSPLQNVVGEFRNFGFAVTSLGAAFTALGASIAAPVALALNTFAEFDDELRFVAGITQSVGEEFQSVTNIIRELGRTTSFTAIEVSKAAAELARSNFNPREIEEALPAILDLARATKTDLPTASRIAVNALRIFSKETSETTNVVDVLVETVNKSEQTLVDYSEALKLVGVSAAGFGVSLETVSASIAALARTSVRGSLASTSLRKSLVQLADPKIRQRLEDTLGIVIGPREFSNLPRTLQLISTQLKALGKEDLEEVGTFFEIFGLRAANSALAISRAADEVDAFAERLRNVDGVAARIAENIDAGIGGAFRLSKSAVTDLGITIAQSLAGPISGVSALAQDAVNNISVWITENQEAALSLGIVAGATILAGVAITGLGLVILSAGAAIGVAGLALAALASPLVGIPLVLGTIATAFTGVVTASLFFNDSLKSLGRTIKNDFSDTLELARISLLGIADALSSGNLKLAAEIAITGIKATLFSGLEDILDNFQEWGLRLRVVIGEIFSDILSLTTDFITAFRSGISTGFSFTAARISVAGSQAVASLESIVEAARLAAEELRLKAEVDLQGDSILSPSEILQKAGFSGVATEVAFRLGIEVEGTELGTTLKEIEILQDEIDKLRDNQLSGPGLIDTNLASATRELGRLTSEVEKILGTTDLFKINFLDDYVAELKSVNQLLNNALTIGTDDSTIKELEARRDLILKSIQEIVDLADKEKASAAESVGGVRLTPEQLAERARIAAIPKSLTDAAEALRRRLRTPTEKFEDAIEQLKEFRINKLIDDDFLQRGVKAAREQLREDLELDIKAEIEVRKIDQSVFATFSARAARFFTSTQPVDLTIDTKAIVDAEEEQTLILDKVREILENIANNNNGGPGYFFQ